MVNWIFYIRSMEFIYNDEFSNGVVIEDNGDGFAVAIERRALWVVCVCVCVCVKYGVGGRESGNR